MTLEELDKYVEDNCYHWGEPDYDFLLLKIEQELNYGSITDPCKRQELEEIAAHLREYYTD